jgi:hypothetical protein
MGMNGLWRREDAQQWLARHRLPADEATVAFVAERLRSRRRGWLAERLVTGTLLLVGWWLLARDQVSFGPESLGWVPVAVTIAMAVDVLRRWLIWGWWDRRLMATQAVRVASLSRPTWDDLVGRTAVWRAGALLGAVLLIAVGASVWAGAAKAAFMAYFVLLAAVYPAVLLEVARRRSPPAGDEVALAVNDRLRGEEANSAATDGLFLVVLAPVVAWGSNVTVSLAVFVGYLFVVSAVRHRYAYEQVEGQLVAR